MCQYLQICIAFFRIKAIPTVKPEAVFMCTSTLILLTEMSDVTDMEQPQGGNKYCLSFTPQCSKSADSKLT